ncbi:MAG: putative Ig domain-containing protein [bacterium]
MNWNIDKDISKGIKKVYARTKGTQKGSDTSKGQNTGQSVGKKALWDLSKGIRLKIQLKWIIISLLLLMGFVFLFLKGGDNPQKLSSENKQAATGVPKIKHVYIKPMKPNSIDDLLADVTIEGSNQDKVGFRYQWHKNDHQIENERGKGLSHIHFKKGDVISVSVIPVMRGVSGKPVSSSSVEIKNSPPALQSVLIQPQVVYSNTDLMAKAEAEDPDQELVSFGFQWIKNGSEIYSEESEHLNHSHFVKGDRIQVKVTPFDGYGHGTPMISSVIPVNNSPPNIISNPPSTFEEDGTFVYRVIAEDIDNDTLTFSLSANNPPGAKIDPKTGLLLWKIPNDLDPGPNRMEVIVCDQDGSEASQWFTLNINFVVSYDHT